MPSRRRDLLRPRSLALLSAALAGGWLASRLRTASDPKSPDEWPPEPYWFPAPLVGFGILLACGLSTSGYLGWTAISARMQARAVAVALTRGEPDNAPGLFVRYGCGGCHTIPGAPGADGKVAAPLTDMRARVYVAGVLPNTADNLVRWILDPPAYSPRTAMPVTGITEQEARDVAAFLYSR